VSWLFEFEIGGVPFRHAAPLLVFGPIFLAFLYYFGIRGLLKSFGKGDEKDRQAAQLHEKPDARRRRASLARVKVEKKRTALQWLAQAAAYTAFAVGIGYFSNAPTHSLRAADQAVVKLSMSLPGERIEECRRRTPEELAKLPPNMRAKMKCSRTRWPVLVELEMDGRRIYRRSGDPRGLSDDGPSSLYWRFTAPAGGHRLAVRVRDRGGKEDFDYVLEQDVELEPSRVLVIGFDSIAKRIVVK